MSSLVDEVEVLERPAVAPPPSPEAWQGEPPAARAARVRSFARGNVLDVLLLGSVLLLGAFLNLVGLDREGFGNTYYAAAVWSMLQNWHAFLFNSFDAGGFVTVDKPPLGLWLQVVSARLLGFNGVALLLPQALGGVASVGILYLLVRRAFGRWPAVVAALALAVTPISVVTDRNNTMDAVLVVTLLLAVWLTSLAAERGDARLLLGAAALVGLGFNVKMLQAYPVVPGFALAYGLCAPISRWRRGRHLLAAGLVLAVVSLAWCVMVDATPSALRPYIGSSGNNSALSLVLGYNGLSRLTLVIAQHVPVLSVLGNAIALNVAPAQAPGIGNPGPFRLLGPTLAGQASWLLPLGLVGLAVAGWRLRRIRPLANPVAADSDQLRRQRVGLMVWGGWLLASGLIFSAARFYHVYYLIMLGPAAAASAGIAIWALWRTYRQTEPRWAPYLLPAAVVGTAWLHAHILADTRGLPSWLVPMLVACTAVSVVALVWRAAGSSRRVGWSAGALALAVVALTIGPLFVSIASVQAGDGGAWLPQASVGGGPFGGPAGRGGPAGQGFAPNGPGIGRAGPGFGMGGAPAATAITFAGASWNQLDPALVAYLEQQQGSTRYLVATTSSTYASLFMLDSGQPAMALGGYQGWDRILSPADLAASLANDTVRFFYLPVQPTAGRPNASLDATADLAAWVGTSCSAVPASTWQSTPSRAVGGMQLYDCAGAITG
jgi:4-amino-4-deoxy-L-arabinose transferase-like glycosyltransferase